MSVAKNLMAGRILEDRLFPYPSLRDKDREVLGMMIDAIDQFLGPKHQDFKRWDRAAEQPAEFIQGLRDLGLFGLIIRRAGAGSFYGRPGIPGFWPRAAGTSVGFRPHWGRTVP